MESTHERDYQARVTEIASVRFLPNSTVEIIREVDRGQPPRFALFDFDGTLSLIRDGWTEIMVSMLVEILQQTGTDETDGQLTQLVEQFVAELTGKQTIYQMLRLAEKVQKRGGEPLDPLEYKSRYHERLMKHIAHRREALRSGAADATEMLVPFSLELLEELKRRDVELYLASGTDENYVREEVELLGLAQFFGQHVYGAVDDHKKFSKQMIIERILQENGVEGSRLVGFGDGYVEIDNVKSTGGIAVGVASDESGRSGRPDAWKRERLIGVGADVIVPDFRDYAAVCAYLWNEL